MQRINQILNLIDRVFDLLIDVGSDHAALGIKALALGKAKNVWNVEVAHGPLNISKQNFQASPYFDKASFYLSDGFAAIPDEIPLSSLAVIAGMGSKQIVNILEAKMPANLKHLILFPHNHPFLIREWANKHQWVIANEVYYKTPKHIYLLMVLDKASTKVVDAVDIYVGNPSFIERQLPVSAIYLKTFHDKIVAKDKKFWSTWENAFIASLKSLGSLNQLFDLPSTSSI